MQQNNKKIKMKTEKEEQARENEGGITDKNRLELCRS